MVVSIVAMMTGTGDGVAAIGATLLNTIVTEAGNGEDKIPSLPTDNFIMFQMALNNEFSENSIYILIIRTVQCV